MLLRSFHHQKHTRLYDVVFSNWDSFYLKGYLLNGYTLLNNRVFDRSGINIILIIEINLLLLDGKAHKVL